MPIDDQSRWKAASPFLDQALEEPEANRAQWLESLRIENPRMAADVEKLLLDQRALLAERFLEQNIAPPPNSIAAAGQPLGAYTLVSRIGHGGMGTVWLAERNDGRFDRRAAVKFLNLALLGRGGEERFRREGSILGRLAHPNIAQLMDAGVSAGQPYLVLEHVDGEHIDDYCDRQALDVEARVRLFLDVLGAVAHAHANLVVHRDIKPSNVLVTTAGEVKLLDFGIAKLLEEDAHEGAAAMLTRESGWALTPEYAAPEQVTGGNVSTATDVYALGALLYVLVTGQHPTGSGARSPAHTIKAIVEIEPCRASELVSSNATAPDLVRNAERRSSTPARLRRVLLGDLDTVLAKALKKNPQERYASVTALADDLRRYLDHAPITARPDTFAYRAAKFVRRNRLPVALAASAVIAMGAGIISTAFQAHTAELQRDYALRQLTRAEAVNDLNTFLLSDAAPSGKPFTVNDLLARAEHIVGRQRGDTDASRVELLISIGRQYWTLDEDDKARRILEAAYSQSRALPDPSPHVRAACALASALTRAGELPAAEALIREGIEQLPDEVPFVLDRVFCLQQGAEVARAQGSSLDAIALGEIAQRLLKQAPFQSPMLDLQALMGLAESYRVAGRQREAIAVFERASMRLTSLGRDDTATAGTLFNNWGLALSQLGRPFDAEAILGKAIAISRANSSDHAAVSPMLLINYARTLRDLGRIDEAAGYAELGRERAQFAGDETVIDQAYLLLASIYREQGDLARGHAMLTEVAPRLRAKLPPGHIAFAALISEESLLAQARGDVLTALDLANRATAIAEASVSAGRQGSDFLPMLFIRRAEIQLERARYSDAAVDARRALSLLEASAHSSVLSSTLGRAYWVLGRILHAQGKSNEVGGVLRSAAEHLQSSIGVDHFLTRRVVAQRDLNGPWIR